MANPISTNTAPFPPLSEPFVDPQTGVLTQPWYLSYLAVYNRTGGAKGADISGIQNTATRAHALSTAAQQQAALAQSAADTAQTSADTAQSAASAANATAIAALAATGGALMAADNLADVPSLPIARANLGVDTVPISFCFDSLPSGLNRFVPIVQSLTLPANFLNTVTWCGVLPTADADFTVSFIRAGVTGMIGTIRLIHGGNYCFLSPQPAVQLEFGDILQLTTPSPPDATLAFVGITISLSLT